MRLIAIDPGPTKSAIVEVGANGQVFKSKTEVNHDVLSTLKYSAALNYGKQKRPHLVIEMIACYGMAVGADVFETCVWIGRFIQAYERTDIAYTGKVTRIPRPDVKLHICGNRKAKDANIRQACIDRYGGGRKALGAIKCKTCKGKGWIGRGRPTCPDCEGSGWEVPPGPLQGIKGDEWAALALALTWIDRRNEKLTA